MSACTTLQHSRNSVLSLKALAGMIKRLKSMSFPVIRQHKASNDLLCEWQNVTVVFDEGCLKKRSVEKNFLRGLYKKAKYQSGF